MAMYAPLPQTTYRPRSPVQAIGSGRCLNTIIEDDEASSRGSYALQKTRAGSQQKQNWHTPQSDHFPTPRGKHFLSAPIIASSPSDSESSSTCPPSEPWTKRSESTEDTDFDDLYDVSSEDEDYRRTCRIQSKRHSVASTASRRSLPPLTIPATPADDHWAEVQAFKAMISPVKTKGLLSPVLPTPTPNFPHSPALFSMLQDAQNIPSVSAPPSLDGSLNSEQLAHLSAPPTPDVGYESDDAENGWGVQLQPAAMATLQALSGEDVEDLMESNEEQVIEVADEPLESSVQEMQEMQRPPPRLPGLNTDLNISRRPASLVVSPSQMQSLNLLTRLDIPSPGGFFGSLSGMARHSWHLVPVTPKSPRGLQPPSSTTAENFYNTPWTSLPNGEIASPRNRNSAVDLPAAPPIRPELRRTESSEETVTAKAGPAPTQPSQSSPEPEAKSFQALLEDLEPDELSRCDAVVVPQSDRTYLWLAAQYDYLSEIINPKERRDDEVALLQRAVSVKNSSGKPGHETSVAVENSPASPPRKTVRFSEFPIEACPLPKILQESTYFQAFRFFSRRSRSTDAFSHRFPRFEAIQAQRVTFPDLHRNQLLGKYQLSVVPSSPHRRMSANVARGDETTVQDPDKIRRDKVYEASEQMSSAQWNVMASKLLNGGRLINAPITNRLSRLSMLGPRASGIPRDRLRILDLGGQPTCDWAWQCAIEYPNCKIYTVTTKALRQLSNSNLRGPSNHRQVSVERLTRLPFCNNQFDVISAREIYSILRESGENGIDEWDLCLTECMRILKPGGYLDFSVMDSDIINAGPLGNAKSVEFGFNLKTLGYDATPTKQWLSRLRRNGFVGIKRAWVFLPMGASIETKHAAVYRDSLARQVPVTMEAMVTGSTDAAASVTGLVGGWAWERWMLRCRVQSVGEGAALEGIQDVIEEGRVSGAGWRTLNGWARKPF